MCQRLGAIEGIGLKSATAVIAVTFELDHFFILTEVGAPAAERLIAAGLKEGPANTHSGQGRGQSWLDTRLPVKKLG